MIKMDIELMEHIKNIIAESVATGIEKNVNGKIRAMDKKLDDYILVDKQWKELDEKWKLDAQPVINMGKDSRTFARVLVYILGTLATVWGSWRIIVDYFLKK